MTADGFETDAPFMPDAVPTEADPVTGAQVPIAGDVEPANEPAQITVPKMKQILRDASETLDGWAGLGSGRQLVKADLALTAIEIDMIAPGVCKYANARPAVRAAFGPNEYLKLGIGTIMYGFRVTNEHRASLEDALDAQAAELLADDGPGLHVTEPVNIRVPTGGLVDAVRDSTAASVGEAIRNADGG